MTSNSNKLIETLIAMTPEEWGSYAFSREPLKRKISAEQKQGYIIRANNSGIKEANTLKKKYKNKNIYQIIELLKIKLIEEDSEGSDNYIVFAKYNYPDVITIYLKNIEKLENYIKKNNLETIIGKIDLKAILLCHEFYHYLEEHENNVYSKNEKLVLWSFFKYQHRSSIIALQEIAAMSFTKEMLDLEYNPYLFDFLFLLPHNEQKALTMIRDVLSLVKKEV